MGPELTFQHAGLAAGGWEKLSLDEQLGNIGSEISRALGASRRGNSERMQKAVFRALELFDLTLESCQKRRTFASLREICRAREETCDYFLGENSFGTNPDQLLRYYDQFALRARKNS